MNVEECDRAHIGDSFHAGALLLSVARACRETEHVRVALTVIGLLLFALVAGLVGLRIGPAACVFLAMALLFTDIAHR